MNVVGLDLSLTATGVAYPDGTTSVLTPPKGTVGMARLGWIRDDVVAVAGFDWDATNERLFVIEGYSFGTTRQPNQAHAAGELGGIIRLALYELGVPYVDVPPALLKKFATDKGNATKDAVLVAAVRAGYAGDNNNEADSWWLRQMGLYRYGQATVTATNYRTAAATKIAWPNTQQDAA